MDPFLLGHFGCHVAAKHVAGMVEDDQQDPGVPFEHPQRFEYFRGTRRGKDIANHTGVQKPLADVAAQGRFVSRAAESDDRHFALVFGVGPNDDFVRFEFDLTFVCLTISFEQFGGQIVGVVEEFFHYHDNGLASIQCSLVRGKTDDKRPDNNDGFLSRISFKRFSGRERSFFARRSY